MVQQASENMEISSLCRICLAMDVRMHSIVAGELQEMYESLSLTSLETKDQRPTQACYICFTRLKNCYRLRQSCVRSEELLTEMMRGGMLYQEKLLEHSSSKKPQIAPVKHMSLGLVAQHETDSCGGVDHAYEMYDEVKLEPADPEGITIKTELAMPSNAEESSYNTHTIKIEELGDCINDKITTDAQCPEISEVIVANGTHIGEKPHQCVVCKEYFSKKSDLNNHICTYSDQTMYPCHICKKSFYRNCELSRHMLVHTGEKPYQCHICKKSCSRKDGLLSHLRIHNTKKVKCNVCKKWFPDKNQLDIHICAELVEKSYQCDLCKKCFFRKDHLKTHSRTHTGEKPFQCYKCKKCFSQKAHLNTHVRTHQWRRVQMIKSESEKT